MWTRRRTDFGISTYECFYNGSKAHSSVWIPSLSEKINLQFIRYILGIQKNFFFFKITYAQLSANKSLQLKCAVQWLHPSVQLINIQQTHELSVSWCYVAKEEERRRNHRKPNQGITCNTYSNWRKRFVRTHKHGKNLNPPLNRPLPRCLLALSSCETIFDPA